MISFTEALGYLKKYLEDPTYAQHPKEIHAVRLISGGTVDIPILRVQFSGSEFSPMRDYD